MKCGSPLFARTASLLTALGLALGHGPVALAAPPAPRLSTAAPASAASTEIEPKAAILPLKVDGALSEADREALTRQLVEGLQRGDFEVVAPDQVGDAAGRGDCSKPSCIQEVAAQTGATHIVLATVEVVDRDYTIRVELYDGADGTKLVSSSEGCEICGVADVGGLMETQAAILRTKLDVLATGPSAVVIQSTPEGAEVTLDGEPFGLTPIDNKTVLPGDHVIRVSKDGYIAVQEQRTFVEGAREILSYELEKVPSRLPKRPWGWASLGIGIGALGAGLTLTYAHERPYTLGGRCEGPGKDAEGNCEFLHNTKWGAVSLGIAGGALITLGVAVLITTSKSPRKQAKRQAAVNQRLQLGAGGVGLRF